MSRLQERDIETCESHKYRLLDLLLFRILITIYHRLEEIDYIKLPESHDYILLIDVLGNISNFQIFHTPITLCSPSLCSDGRD